MSSSERIIRVIETVVSHQHTGIRFAEIVEETQIAKATVHRLLGELIDLGILTFSFESKRYRGSLKLASLGAGVIANFNLRSHVHPQLIKLHEETNHTCNMGIKQGDVGIYTDKIESHDYGIKLFSEVGKTFPLYCTALGKVLLAFSPAVERKRVLSLPMKPFTPKTVTNARQLARQLVTVREQRYALDSEEITRGIICIAAPVFGPQEEILCAISVTFPAYLAEERGIEADIEAIKRHASAISGITADAVHVTTH
jgi:IclR family transcriptional regulator, acetate operon repressor